nr:MAG TPA: hypothetical protein [Caudoviricetes sp.]
MFISVGKSLLNGSLRAYKLLGYIFSLGLVLYPLIRPSRSF